LARYLRSIEIDNRVVDSSSIEVSRRSRKPKTDRIDVGKLLAMLIRYHNGEEKAWRVVRVPTVEEEDWRQLHRELKALKRARTRQVNRIKGLLASQGVRMAVKQDFLQLLPEARTWDGKALPGHLRARLEREYERLAFTEQQIQTVEAERLELIRTCDDPCVQMVRQLLRLKAIGPNSAWLFTMEFFGWRQFKNRRQVGALAGLTPTPFASGSRSQEQGISKAGNRHVRGLAIELAWIWLRYQPDSELSRWYQERFGHGNNIQRKIGIVALARKLLIALWRYLETGLVPTGAVLKDKPI
jgi:transposase